MRNHTRATLVLAIAFAQFGCGFTVPQIPEVWDLVADTDATQHMEMQIKKAIFCELREAVYLARRKYHYENFSGGTVVTTKDDQPVPDAWGAQITLTFTVDEASKLNPGVSFISPVRAPSSMQTFTAGLGGTVSSDATRIDKFETFYTIAEIANVYSENDVCSRSPSGILGPESHSSLFLVSSDLGIKEWLPGATAVSGFLRSTRAAANGEGAPMSSGASFASDSISYDIKFLIVTDGNVTPTWKLIRLTTPASPAFFDTSRTRTHDLLITIGPGATTTSKTANGTVVKRTVGPSQAAASSHLAQEIGNAVSAGLRPLLTSP
jgi:hypothetical protein